MNRHDLDGKVVGGAQLGRISPMGPMPSAPRTPNNDAQLAVHWWYLQCVAGKMMPDAERVKMSITGRPS